MDKIVIPKLHHVNRNALNLERQHRLNSLIKNAKAHGWSGSLHSTRRRKNRRRSTRSRK